LGNLSNPSITRWGLNLFWYNYWFTDVNKFFQFHQDNLINKLLYIYLNYGIFRKTFKHSYRFWNFSNLKIVNDELSYEKDRMMQYLRFSQYKNKMTGELKILSFRIRRKDLHFTKFWILRFHDWLVINVYSLQPLKKKSNIGKFLKKIKHPRPASLLRKFKVNKLKKNLIRHVLIFNFFKSLDLNFNNKYFF